jgi:multidrug resistance efflux pump
MWKFIYLVLIAVLAIAAVAAVNSGDERASSTEARTGQPIQTVAGSKIFAQGVVEAATGEIDLRPSLTGPVEAIFVAEGQLVEAGQPLLRLEDRHYQQRSELARAEVLEAQAKQQRLSNGPTAYERAELEAQYQAKVAELRHEETLSSRVAQLLQSQAITQQKADDQFIKLETLKAEVAAARSRLDRLNNEPRNDDLQIANASVAAASARYELAVAEHERTTLRASIAGRVAKLNIDVGEVTGPAALEPAAILVDPTRLRVRAYVEELDAPQLRLGMATRITADGLNGRQYAGRLTWLSARMGTKTIWSNRPDERRDTKTREVTIDLDGSSEDLVVGLRVDVFIDKTPVVASLPQKRVVAKPGVNQ